MDLVSGLLVLLSSLGGGAGYLVDDTARTLLRQQLDQADVLEVRVESRPNYRLLNGGIDRILIAGRGLHRKPFPRLEVLELETDPIQLETNELYSGKVQLQNPLQAALRVIIRAEDLNRALSSPEILAQFQNIQADIPMAGVGGQQRFDLRNPYAQFLPDNRIQLSAQLVQQGPNAQALDLAFTAGVEIVTGQRVRLIQPEFTVGSVPVPSELSGPFLGSLNEVFNLADLEKQGLLVRILKLRIDPEKLELVGFVRLQSLPVN